MSLKRYLCLVLLAAWNIGSWVFLINVPFPVSSLFLILLFILIAFYSQSIKLHPYSDVITKAFGCLLAASALFLGQKTVIQVIGKAKKIRDNDNMELTIIFSCQISSNCF